MKRMNQTVLFLILTFVLSFSLVVIHKLTGGGGPGSTRFTVLGIFYMFIPMLSVVVVKKIVHKEKLRGLYVSCKLNRWFFIAWVLMPCIAVCTFGINLMFPNVQYSPQMSGLFEQYAAFLPAEQIEQMQASLNNLPFDIFWITLLQAMVAGITVNAIAGFGEELGWRGFLVKEFRQMSFVRASLLIGFIWGLWHTPMILMGHNYPQHPYIGVLMMTIWCILLSPIFLYITIKAKSVIAAAILHGTLNASAGLAILKIEGGNDLTNGVTGLAGFFVLLVCIACLFLFDLLVTKEKVFTNKISTYL
ncbi:MAG: CPBP family intramembrane glutamic endopeptidase [Sphaerochaetaceae bacterium]